MYRLGAVSFLNARPLIAGLADDGNVELLYDVPANLSNWLEEGYVDAALIPTVDILRGVGRFRILSDACIGSDGETMTVRIFSEIPPDQIRTLWVDGDSHTSAALATVLWRRVYGRKLELRRLDARRENLAGLTSVLLIGDKVVSAPSGIFSYEMDLGDAWRTHTGLPFVFAMWACLSERVQRKPTPGQATQSPREPLNIAELANLLEQARDLGVAEAAKIAAVHGPDLGWPVALAKRYLARYLNFKLDPRDLRGAELFGQLCAEADIVPTDAKLIWPQNLSVDARI